MEHFFPAKSVHNRTLINSGDLRSSPNWHFWRRSRRKSKQADFKHGFYNREQELCAMFFFITRNYIL